MAAVGGGDDHAAVLVHRGPAAERHPGLAAALAVQALTLAAVDVARPRSGRFLRRARGGPAVAGGLAHGAAAALRASGARARGWGLAGRAPGRSASPSPQSLVPVAAAFAAGIAAVVRSAGDRQRRARRRTGTRCSIRAPRISATSRCSGPRTALATCATRCTTPSSRRGPPGRSPPWRWPARASGLVRLAARAAADADRCSPSRFVPYLVFDLLFQETFTSRYALPLVVPMAYLAVAGPAPACRGISAWRSPSPLAMYRRARRRHLDRRVLARARRRRSGCWTT